MDLQVEINKIEIKIEDILEKVSKGTPHIFAKFELEDLLQQANDLKALYAPCGKLVLSKIERLIRKIDNTVKDICGFINTPAIDTAD